MSKLVLVFAVRGTNAFLADVGSLTLLSGGKPIMQSTGFSGGLKSVAQSPPIPSGTYHIRLDIRHVAAAFSPADGDTQMGMHHWYGIEKIDTPAWQYEWGHYRATLNETSQHAARAYRGNFLHGKVRAEDYTHGCICERSEVILAHLWSIQPQTVTVEVKR